MSLEPLVSPSRAPNPALAFSPFRASLSPAPRARRALLGARAALLALFSVALLAVTARPALAQDARAAFRVERGEPHAGLPFVLSLIVEGLDETPAPTPPALAIPNAKVVAMGATPNVSQSIQIINGRRVDSREVRWVFRYRVEASQAGLLKVPATTVVQGAKKVIAPGGDIEVSAVSSTDDMKIELKLPTRPVWVGEVLPVEISWLVRRNVEDQTLVVPMLSRDDQFLIAAPPVTNPRQTLAFAAGARDLTLPYEQDQIESGGARYTRFRFVVFATPRRAGKIELAPSSVVAALAVGRPDIFGQSATKLFRAVDATRSLEVKDLPLTDRPASFSGAVGSTFDLSTTASRSVVQLGEPVELTITVRSDQRLDALAAPTLTGEGGLPADKFTLPPDLPSGELSADGTTKVFKLAVQVTGPATEIPALAFSYFDPVKGSFQTTRSQPIALAVRGGSIVGAGDVVSANPAATPATPQVPLAGESMSGADLVLSAPSLTTSAPLGGTTLLLALVLLYAVPLGLWALRSWQRRTATQRGEAAEARSVRRKVESELARAATAPARDCAGPLDESLRALAKALGQPATGAALTRLQTEAYAPSAAEKPLSAELRAELAELAKTWERQSKESSKDSGGRGGKAIATVLLLASLSGARLVEAQPATTAAPAADPAPVKIERGAISPTVPPPGEGQALPSEPAAAPTAEPAPAAPPAAPPTAPAAAAPAAAPTAAPLAPVATLPSDPSDAQIDAALVAARAAYEDAMQLPAAQVSERRERFARAAATFAEVVRALPGRPELLVDWGNAALNAGDVATATLAYRRALMIDGAHPRATHNLSLLRSKHSEAYRASASSATGTLFFFHTWPRSRRLLVGALAFAIAVLLLVPWRRADAVADPEAEARARGRRRGLRALSLVPFAVWAAMTLSFFLEDRRLDDAVVMESVLLRVADSGGAPLAISQPVPRGAEVTVVSRRDHWARIRLPSGSAGWVPTSAIESIVPR